MNKYLLTVAILLAMAFVAYETGLILEGFSDGSKHKTVLLMDAMHGLSEGVATIENPIDRFSISINANIPYHKAGVFHTVDNVYSAYLIKKDNELEPVYLGDLVRYGDRRYRLQAELTDGNYSEYDDIVVIRHNNNGREDVVALQGTMH